RTSTMRRAALIPAGPTLTAKAAILAAATARAAMGAISASSRAASGRRPRPPRGIIKRGEHPRNQAVKLISRCPGRRSTMDKMRAEGAGQKMAGKIKEGAGKLTGDAKLKTEGKADQLAGGAKNAVGG